MSFYFPVLLLILVILCGVIYAVDVLWFSKHRKAGEKPPFLAENARAFFVVLLIVWIIRSFIAQPFVVPTGSLKPTVKPGDFLLVSQFSYGLHLPVWHLELMPTGKPKTGDIMVFHWPVNPKVDLIKRVIGVPGDHISYVNKVLYINGHKMVQHYVGKSTDSDSANGPSWPVLIYQENLLGVKHNILINPKVPAKNFHNLVVPKGEYFMMGDNRDNSDDSRDWGFAPAKDIVGKAEFVLFSWNSATHSPRWHRIGKLL